MKYRQRSLVEQLNLNYRSYLSTVRVDRTVFQMRTASKLVSQMFYTDLTPLHGMMFLNQSYIFLPLFSGFFIGMVTKVVYSFAYVEDVTTNLSWPLISEFHTQFGTTKNVQ